MKLARVLLLAATFGLAAAAHAQGPFAGPPSWLEQLDLSVAQQEDVQRIFLAQLPALRERILAARKAHEQLEDLALAAELDSDAARELADAEDEALEQVSQMRAQAVVQVYRLLTEDQQARMVKLRLQVQ